MRQMTSERMFDNGKYFVIYLLPESVEFDELKFFLWTKNDHEEVMKRGNSCENLESYEDQLMAWKSLILSSTISVSISPSCIGFMNIKLWLV